MAENPAPPVLFEMLQSFTAVARILNISRASQEVGVTRQTVRRHIDGLEQIKGEKLFTITDRQYQLTPAGADCVAEAESILARTQAWLSEHSTTVNGLAHIKYHGRAGYGFYAQQHPLHHVWCSGVPLLQKGLQCWASSQCELEHRAMKKIRPYLVVYRKHRDDWFCVSVGEKSSYATWLGWNWAKSAIGRILQDDPTDTEDDRFIIQAYNSVYQDGGIRYDHIFGQYARGEGDVLHPVSYQRLVFVCRFPDGEPALAALVARTDKIEIEGLDPKDIPTTPKADLMEFDI